MTSWEKSGLTKKGCKGRDELVIRACKKAEIPLVITMGRGYSARLHELVEAHCHTFRTAIDICFP